MINKRLQDTVTALGSRLPETVGVGPVIAGRLLGRTGRAARLPTAAHLASYTGAAPLEVASGEHARHRLSRAGDRQLNHALHLIAPVQVRSPACPGYHYFRRKLAEARPAAKPCVASSAGSPTTSGGSCWPTNKPATDANSRRVDTQRRPRSSLSTGLRLLLLPVSSKGGLVEPYPLSAWAVTHCSVGGSRCRT